MTIKTYAPCTFASLAAISCENVIPDHCEPSLPEGRARSRRESPQQRRRRRPVGMTYPSARLSPRKRPCSFAQAARRPRSRSRIATRLPIRQRNSPSSHLLHRSLTSFRLSTRAEQQDPETHLQKETGLPIHSSILNVLPNQKFIKRLQILRTVPSPKIRFGVLPAC